jgi:hypothetical protein
MVKKLDNMGIEPMTFHKAHLMLRTGPATDCTNHV